MNLAPAVAAGLRPRLLALLELCPVEGPVADIGSGHGLLAEALAARLPAGQVFATEAKPGPAAELRRLLGPAGRVAILEGQGLTPLRQRGCRGCVIAGLGGHTIARILEEEWELALGLAWICLQPIQQVEWLEGWASGQRAWVVRRSTTLERGRPYHSFLLAR